MVAIQLLAASVWGGSTVCLAVVTSSARSVLDALDQVTLFRAIGRRYATVGTGSLLVTTGAGLWLLWPPSAWSGTVDVAVGLAGLLVAATMAGRAQARGMTRLRLRSIRDPANGDAVRAVQKGRQVANALRAVMATSTLAIVVLAAEIASH